MLDFSSLNDYSVKYQVVIFMTYFESKSGPFDYQYLYAPGHQTDDLYLCYCGRQQCPADHSFGPASRDEYLIHFLTSGRGFYQIQGREYPISRGQAFLVPPHIPTYYYADPDFPYSYVWIAFNGRQAPFYLKKTSLSVQHPVCDLNFPTEHIGEIVSQIMHFSRRTLSSELACTGFLYEILSLLTDDGVPAASESHASDHLPESYVKHAVEFIEHSYSRISVADIADYVGVNRSYLYTIFKKELHMSPQKYLVSFKLTKAADLLLQTDLPMAEIASRTGYNDSLNFSKAFKKQFGCSPSGYRSTKSPRHSTDHMKGEQSP